MVILMMLLQQMDHGDIDVVAADGPMVILTMMDHDDVVAVRGPW